MAVASSASAMPGATTARLVDFEPAIAWNEVMMPTTVPNRPMNGAGRTDGGEEAEPALEPLHLARQRQVHRLVDAHLQAERRLRALLEALLPFAHGGDEDRAHAGRLAVGERAVELLQRLARPEDLLEAVERAAHARE